MRVYCLDTYDNMSRQAANILSAQVILKPDSVLGLATGSTPLGIYRQLISWYERGDLSFSEVRTVNLDEYAGLAPDDTQSYRYFMQKNLFDHINIRKENTNVPDGLASDASAECSRYDRLIQGLGGIDLQLLGLGHNGHIGFNEPEDAFELGTHIVRLTESTISANARFFGGDLRRVPTQAFTMGIKNVMLARSILVVVSGADKAEIVSRAFLSPVTPAVPASILQLHPAVTLVGDRAALDGLLKAGVSVCV